MLTWYLSKCQLVNLPKIIDPNGSLTFLENSKHIPFDIRRVYYLYDIPGGGVRGSQSEANKPQMFRRKSGG